MNQIPSSVESRLRGCNVRCAPLPVLVESATLVRIDGLKDHVCDLCVVDVATADRVGLVDLVHEKARSSRLLSRAISISVSRRPKRGGSEPGLAWTIRRTHGILATACSVPRHLYLCHWVQAHRRDRSRSRECMEVN